MTTRRTLALLAAVVAALALPGAGLYRVAFAAGPGEASPTWLGLGVAGWALVALLVAFLGGVALRTWVALAIPAAWLLLLLAAGQAAARWGPYRYASEPFAETLAELALLAGLPALAAVGVGVVIGRAFATGERPAPGASATGTLVHFDPGAGTGYVLPDGASRPIFFRHRPGRPEEAEQLGIGQRVTFQPAPDPYAPWRTVAERVRPAQPAPNAA